MNRDPMAARALLLASAALSAGAAQAASDRDVAALRAQLEALTQRLEQLEQNQSETRAKVDDTHDRAILSSGKSPGSFIIPGTETEFTIGGYVKGDFIYDTGETAGADLFVPEAITTTGADEEGRARLHARQSRLFIKTSTPTEFGPLKTHLEGDLFGGGGNEVFSNSTTLRLRHAYGQIGGLLVGQTWTNFMPIESYPSTVDFNGPAGLPFIRQAQIRYTHPVSEALSLSASLENSEFSGRDENGTAFGESITTGGANFGFDRAPDMTVAARYSGDGFFVKGAGVGRILSAPDSPGGEGDDEFGWALNLSGNASLWPGGKVLGSFTYGDGVGRYLINGFGQDAFFDSATGELETIEGFGVAVGVSQQVIEGVTVGVNYGRSDFDDGPTPSSLDAVQTVHATLFYSPTDRLTFGAEAIWGMREDINGADDDALRFQTSMQVNF